MTLWLEPTDPDGYDCETCGWNMDQCALDFEDGVWVLEATWGCYHSDGYRGTADEMIAYLRDWAWAHLFTKRSVEDAIRALEEA